MFCVSGSSISSSQSSSGEQKLTLVFFLGGVTFAEIAALRFLAQQDDGNAHCFHSIASFFLFPVFFRLFLVVFDLSLLYIFFWWGQCFYVQCCFDVRLSLFCMCTFKLFSSLVIVTACMTSCLFLNSTGEPHYSTVCCLLVFSARAQW